MSIARLYPTGFLAKRYYKVGCTLGDMVSYSYLGEPIGYSRWERKLKRLEAEYIRRGFKPIPFDDFVQAGGYGVSARHLLLQRSGSSAGQSG